MNYVRCVKNGGYEASLDIGKIYKTLPPTRLENSAGLIRVIDNEGEDYLYDSDYFEPVDLSTLADQVTGRAGLSIYLDPLTKAILHAEALSAHKSISALVREWIDERLDLPIN
ncbi:MAG: hypothetical protein A2Z04_09835 [Chloroflexi bacterium RBG_16_57_9]|nr:MAG: hypothetical protein A2Z04_09835 [Chloroflexi bacterium RBG_16_57_9]